MIYSLVDLRAAGLVVGTMLIVLHGIAILHSRTARSWARAFPRAKAAGLALVAIDAIWAFVMVANMDLGEFSNFRTIMLVLIPIAALLTLKYVDEFLAVRALGMLLLLAAEPLLEAAFLRPEESRLFVVVLAYVWIVLGLFYVAVPYWMRDQILWLEKTETRWKAASALGLAYGAVVLICSLTQYR